jgi:hypothetical protein
MAALAFFAASFRVVAIQARSFPRQTQAAKSQAEAVPHFLNTAEGVAYVGSRKCAECHPSIVEQFQKTDMGHSMFSADDPARMPALSTPVTIFDKKAHQYDQVYRHGNSVYESEYALDGHGREIYRHTEKLAYGVGAGENGYSFIVDRGGFLFQAPLSFYSHAGKWDLSPGHKMGFDRPIIEGCIVCHTGRARPVSGREGLYREPPFREIAVGCENCHGPGELHVRAREKGAPVTGSGDPTIVNPDRLPGWMANNVCEFCHQSGDAVVLAPGKEFRDFRPGTPLDRTVAIFNLPLKEKAKNVSPLLGHYSLMVLSRCYRGSGGKLNCITCHDPHQEVSRQKAPAYYRSKCLGCHQESSCTLPLAARTAQSPPDDCAGCHMPKQSLETIAHSALTNHRIIRASGEPFPKDAFKPQPGMDGLWMLDEEPGNTAPPDLRTLALAYAQISNARPEYRDRLEELLREMPTEGNDNPRILGTRARLTLEDNGAEGYGPAIAFLQRGIQLGSAWPGDYQLLADLLRSTDRSADAISILERGIALDPYFSPFYSSLAACYEDQSDFRDARQTLENGEKLFPEDASIRKELEKLKKK